MEEDEQPEPQSRALHRQPAQRHSEGVVEPGEGEADQPEREAGQQTGRPAVPPPHPIPALTSRNISWHQWTSPIDYMFSFTRMPRNI